MFGSKIAWTYWLRLFSSQTFSRNNTPTFLKLVILQLLTYEYGTECSEISSRKIQTPGNYPEESIQHSEYEENLKSRLLFKTNLKF